MKAPILLIYWLISLHPAFKEAERLIDQQNTHYWEGTQGSTTYMIKVDSSRGMWYVGHLVMDERDTLYLKGFEKGNNHPTQVGQVNDRDSIESIGNVFIWAFGHHADSLELKNDRDSLPQLPISMKLYKKAINPISPAK